LRDALSSAGEITEIKFVTNPDGSFWGTAFVSFADEESANRAVEMNGLDILGRPAKIQLPREDTQRGDNQGRNAKKDRFETPHKQKEEGCLTVFLGNVDDSVEDKDITELFKDCGEITDVRWVMNKQTNSFKGCGFVQFADTSSTDEAIKLHGSTLKGRKVRIDYA